MTPEELKPAHEALQVGLKENQICIREGIVLDIDERSRFGFEFFCWRSPEMVIEMDAFIKYSKGRKSFVDCGSLHGIFSLVFQKITDGTVTSFEPADKAFEILSENTKHTENITPIKVALTNRKGTVSMGEEWEHYVVRTDGEHLCECDMGDSYFIRDASVDIIKIDCEGHELNVLNGLYFTITNFRPLIFLELHLSRLTPDELDGVFELIKRWDYKIIDTETDFPITPEQIQSKTGEVRVMLL